MMGSTLDLHGWFSRTLHRDGEFDKVNRKDLAAAGLDNETVQTILRADRNRDGKLSYDDILAQVQDLVATRRQYRRAARYLTVLVLFLVVIITAIVVGTGLTLKDTTVDANGVFVTYGLGGERQSVATTSVQNAVGIVSNERSFVNMKPLLQEGPTRIALQFNDGSYLQFEPRFIQVFESTATVANKEVGVTLRLRTGSAPNVEYTVEQSQFAPQTTPTLTGNNAQSSAAAAVSLITVYSPRARALADVLGNETVAAPTTPKTTSENQKTAFVAANDALKKDVIAELELSLQTRLSLKAKRLLEKGDHYVLLGVNASSVPAVCDFINSVGAACGHNASLGDYYVGVAELFGFLPLTANEVARAAIKAWVRESGNPYNVTGFEPRFKAELASVITHRDAVPHPVHRALHQSAHRALLGTAAGKHHLRRKLEALQPHEREDVLARTRDLESEAAAAAAATAGSMKRTRSAARTQTTPEKEAPDAGSVRRQNARGLLPLQFRNAAARQKEEHVTCYSPAEPQLYRGTDVTTFEVGADEVECDRWEDFFADPQICESAWGSLSAQGLTDCFCEHLGLSPRLASTHEALVGNSPRAPCEGMQKPVCLNKRTVESGWTLQETTLPECSSAYFAEVFKRWYLPFASETPVFDDGWNWNLERVVKWSANYGSEGAYPDLAFCGAGVHVFVIDSGINYEHNDFLTVDGRASRIGDSYNAVERQECPAGSMEACYDTGGHGTHVAGTVAGRRYGLAPCATIHSVKIMEGHAGASIDTLETGISWAIRYHNANIRGKFANGKKLRSVVVASINAEAPVSHLNNMFSIMTWNGMSVAVAAGNNDVDACQSSPASAGGKSGTAVVTVAASAIDDSKAPYSNWGSCVDLFAPGTGIASAAPFVREGYSVLSGTSMAAPLVAGVMALVSEAYPTYNPLVVKAWVLWHARQGRIQAVAPTQIVSEAYVAGILKRPGSLTVKELEYLTESTRVQCIAGNCIAKDAHEIDASPNLLLRIPRNDLSRTQWWRPVRRMHEAEQEVDLQVISPPATPPPTTLDPFFPTTGVQFVDEEDEVPLLVCNWTISDVGAPCPQKGAPVCGSLRGTDPSGAAVLRPFKRREAVCPESCWCDPDAVEAEYVAYQTCVSNPEYPVDFEYTGELCSPVYQVDSAADAEAMQGKTLRYSPLPGGVEFNEPQVLVDKGVIVELATAESEKSIVVDGEELYMSRPVKLPIGTDSSVKQSLWGSETFNFFGSNYESIFVNENGYVCFRESVYRAATPSREDHFAPSKGPCFSFFLTDLTFDKRASAGVYLTHIFAGAVAPYTPRATVLTYYLASADGDASGATFSVQARLEYFTNTILVAYDSQLPTVPSALIGPSNGFEPEGFEESSAIELVYS